jgi:multicomponent Na+:H+ antiporter subunit B
MVTGLIGRIVGRLLIPFIFIFGYYVITHGHLSPGGGFQGGVIIATGSALLLVCYHYHEYMENYLDVINFKLVESIGLIFFICTAFVGLVLASSFFFNWLNACGGLFGNPVAYGINSGDIFSAGTIPLMNFAVGIEVFAGLSVVMLYMFSGLKEILCDDEEELENFAQVEDFS